MPSNSGSLEPRLPRKIGSLADLRGHIKQRLIDDGIREPLTTEEQQAIADGEPYCFRCGKPASSFEAYDTFENEEREVPGSRAACVKREEGTYNRAANRFACDACYIAIGTPAGPGGWKAP